MLLLIIYMLDFLILQMDAYAIGATLWSLVFRMNPADWDLMDAVNSIPYPACTLYR